jgi:hypothetical protein
MQRRLPKDLLALAKTVRRAAEFSTLGKRNLAGECVRTAVVFASLAYAKLGIELDVVAGHVHARANWCFDDDGWCHAWTSYNGLVVDLTATQFWRCPKVYVVDASHPRYRKVFARNADIQTQFWHATDLDYCAYVWENTERLLRGEPAIDRKSDYYVHPVKYIERPNFRKAG